MEFKQIQTRAQSEESLKHNHSSASTGYMKKQPENGADLHVNERLKIRHYRVRSAEERRMPNGDFFFTSRGKVALYSDLLMCFHCPSVYQITADIYLNNI